MIEAFAGLRTIQGLFSDAEQWLVKKLGVPICIDGCGLCCMQNTVTIYSIEASLILSYLIGSGKTSAIELARGWLLERHRQAPTYEGMPFGAISGSLQQEWMALTRLPCIFLDSDKRCIIHKFRPLPCRAYGVTMVPQNCPRPAGIGEGFGGRMYVGDQPGELIKGEVKRFFTELKEKNPDWAKMGFLTTMLFRQAREREFRELVADNKIASAKLVGTSHSTQMLWQKDLDFLWQMETEMSQNLVKA